MATVHSVQVIAAALIASLSWHAAWNVRLGASWMQVPSRLAHRGTPRPINSYAQEEALLSEGFTPRCRERTLTIQTIQLQRIWLTALLAPSCQI